MFADRTYRLISYHDTWISLDPIQGCPYECVYCVLRHAGNTGIKKPRQVVSPKETVERLLRYPFFVKGSTYLAIGNETDMLHPRNCDYLILLLSEMSIAGIDKPNSLDYKGAVIE